jgi:aminoglycoside phosphotransferase (APT) family kinase protein
MIWQPDTDACRYLLRRAFPDLEIASINVLGEGWDSVAFLVNGALVFRLPTRDSVEAMLRRERQLLDAIAGRLPTAVPRYELVADNLPGFPSSVGGYRHIAGMPLSDRAIVDLQLARLAMQLSGVLNALHAIDPVTIPGLDRIDPDVWWRDHWRLYQDSTSIIDRTCSPRRAAIVRHRWEAAFATACEIGFTPMLIHRDLAMDHILHDQRGQLAGLIDFGDAGAGDPAIDLAGLPDLLAERVLDCYAPDPQERNRLRQRRAFYRLTVPFHAIVAGLTLGRADLIDQGLAGITERFGV